MAAPLALLLACLLASSRVQAGPPDDLSNFQENFACDAASVDMARPATVKDLKAVVGAYDRIQAVGLGHSWNSFACPETGAGRSVGVAMTTIKPLRMDVDEDAMTVEVSAGVKTRDLLDFLSTHGNETGYTLPGFPWFIDQTIGGAVATGTHGSSVTYGSLSSSAQLLALNMVLANGTEARITPESHPLLMAAARVGVGRLGIITTLTMRIKKEMPVTRTWEEVTVPELVADMLRYQDHFKSTGEAHPELAPQTTYWWYPSLQTGHRVTFASQAEGGEDEEPPSGPREWRRAAANAAADAVDAARGRSANTTRPGRPTRRPFPSAAEIRAYLTAGAGTVAEAEDARMMTMEEAGEEARAMMMAAARNVTAAGWDQPDPKPINRMFATGARARLFNTLMRRNLRMDLPPGTFEARGSYLSMSERGLQWIEQAPYDQYEVSIGFETMGDCLAGLADLQSDADVASAFTGTPHLLRFVRAEPEALLSQTTDGPRVYINMEDYIYYNSGGTRNPGFYETMRYLRGDPKCTGSRVHFGKAGWPDEGCWDGFAEFPTTWCDFGCAVEALDPGGKFEPRGSVFNWEGADILRCCGPMGFDTAKEGCTCEREPKPAVCAAPGY